jgi:hypothetical protein
MEVQGMYIHEKFAEQRTKEFLQTISARAYTTHQTTLFLEFPSNQTPIANSRHRALSRIVLPRVFRILPLVAGS